MLYGGFSVFGFSPLKEGADHGFDDLVKEEMGDSSMHGRFELESEIVVKNARVCIVRKTFAEAEGGVEGSEDGPVFVDADGLEGRLRGLGNVRGWVR